MTVFALFVSLSSIVGLVWAQEKRQEKAEEDLVRAASFSYYTGTVFGDADTCLGAARTPLCVVKDGAIHTRDEKAMRTLLTGIADHLKSANLTDEDRKRIAANMIALFDEASIQFVGANTATCTFLVHKGAKESDGDNLATLVLHRAEGKWRVIEEITDSAPVPPGYLLDVPKKGP